MPLLLVDLDNTLVDRAGAFGRWAQEFAWARGAGAAGAAWLTAADRDGLESRERLAAMIGERFGLDFRGEAGVLADLRGGLVRQIAPDEALPAARTGMRQRFQGGPIQTYRRAGNRQAMITTDIPAKDAGTSVTIMPRPGRRRAQGIVPSSAPGGTSAAWRAACSGPARRCCVTWTRRAGGAG